MKLGMGETHGDCPLTSFFDKQATGRPLVGRAKPSYPQCLFFEQVPRKSYPLLIPSIYLNI